MTSPRITLLVNLIAIVGAATLVPRAATAGHVASGPGDATVAVYDARYVAGGRSYESLDALESAVREARPSALLLVACTPAAARAWLAAVPRFEDIPMHLDVVAATSPVCPAVPMRAGAPAATGAQADSGVQQYWNRRMP
jgi:hypothetical protein